jgi:DNA-binding beta-propeller fold protein YncE
MERRDQLTLTSSEILLRNGLEVPDGLAVNNGNRWIAISNHDRNCVFLYENKHQLNTQSKPDGFLCDIIYPHGIRFTPDDNYVIVADAGSPYVNIYAKNGDNWAGTHVPQATLRVMDEAAYWRGRINPQEGGPKGIDIDREMNVLVTTCEEKVLQFFDLRWMLGQRGVPMDKRVKYLWWRHGWRYERFKRRLQGERA